jgi:hypothetical protein
MTTCSAAIPVDAIGPGHHVCGLFDRAAERHEVLVEYVEAGLAAGERVWVFTDARPGEDLAATLAGAGVDVAGAQRRGALALVAAADSYLRELPFTPERMVADLHAAVDAALADGYTGFRVTGDMGWAARDLPGADRLEEYERAVEEVYATRPATGLCQYTSGEFPHDRLAGLCGSHTHVAQRPVLSETELLRIHRLAAPGWLRVSGEADVTGALLLRDEVERTEGDVHLDVRRLRFADVCGLRPLTELARERRIVLHHPTDGLRRLLMLLKPSLPRLELVA